MYHGYYRWRWRRRIQPRKVKGGIKPDSRRGEIGRSWLAREWMDMVGDADPGGEFDRGKTYARRGQVLSISAEMGVVAGSVQGSLRHPYHTIIKFSLPGVNHWRRFAGMLKEQPVLAARMLSGEMSGDVEGALQARGLTLFHSCRVVNVSCGCQRWTAICRHAAAVCHILAEEFDRDPFLYLRIFGVGREDLLEMMGLRAGRARDEGPAAAGTPAGPAPGSGAIHSPTFLAGGQTTGAGQTEEPPLDGSPGGLSFVLGGLPPSKPAGGASGSGSEPVPLPDNPAAFWGRPDQVELPYLSESASMEDAALPKEAGSFPMWRGDERFVKVMEGIYHRASVEGVNAHLGIRNGTGGRRGRPAGTGKG